MRVFSDFDKAFINKILALKAADEKILFGHEFFKDLINAKSQVYITGRAVHYQLQDGEHHYHKIELSGKNDDIPEDYFKVTGAFYQANDLFNYLLENGFLLRHEGSPALGIIFNMLPEAEKQTARRQEIKLDKLLQDLLDKLTYHYIPTEALKDLAENKFRTKDERHNRTTRIISIVSAIITLLGLCINYYVNKNKNDPPPPQTIIIDSTSLNRIIEKMKYGNINVDTNSMNYFINKFTRKTKTTKDTIPNKKTSGDKKATKTK